ncbi:uncharacterized protein LOC119681886 [Teleopsis dalmanni]|uniref:uncharacterized protein LOC119681886 n=1 Tax=Teleopsis dalmanni TaxID=139649 RepID=UPI0018CF01C0|nr:uncharacterized protein LOC119681886 [Teleopsis dalmanni]
MNTTQICFANSLLRNWDVISNLKILPLVSSAIKLYSIDYRKNCKIIEGPRCSPVELAKTKCGQDLKNNVIKKPYIFLELIRKPECCLELCPDPMPRFDDLYYKESDKLKRVYTRTWKACTGPLIKKKRFCSYDNLPALPYKKRDFRNKPKTACREGDCTKFHKKCTKIVLPGCKNVPCNVKCTPGRKPSNCKKKCTQYPAFSECRKPKFRKLRPVECNCLKDNALCDLYNYLRKKIKKRQR